MVQVLNRPQSFQEQLLKGAGAAVAEGAAIAGEMWANKIKSDKQQEAMKSFADQLEKNNPGSDAHKNLADLYRSNIPAEQKSQIAKDIAGIDPFKADQQERLKKQEIRTSYNQRIKEAVNHYEKVAKGSAEKEQTRELIKRLQTERDIRLGFDKGEKDALSELKKDVETVKKKKKPKFNEKNAEHRAKAEQLYGVYKDKKKVMDELSKEFEF